MSTMARTRVVRRFQKSPSPAWVVWLADMFIVVGGTIITALMHGMTVDGHSGFLYSLPVKTVIFAAVYSFTSWIFGSYRYVVRLSVFIDVLRLVKLIITSSLILLFADIVGEIATGMRYFRIWNIFNVAVMSFSLMVLMRLFIKVFYASLIARGLTRTRVVILGTSLNSIHLATAFEEEISGQYEPVAYLALSPGAPAKIGGIPVYTYDKDRLKEIFDEVHSGVVLFNTGQLDVVREHYADTFMNLGIKLLISKLVSEMDKDDSAGGRQSMSAGVRNIHIEDLLERDPIRTDNPRISQVFSKQCIMITGAAGSIGSEIVKQLAKLEASDLVLIDQAETPMHELQLMMQEQFPNQKIHLFVGDITNAARMEAAFSAFRPRYVFHAAAYKHVPMMECNPSEAVNTNVFGTKIIADLAVKYGVEKFVMVSTDKAVNPTNIMGATKRIAEIYVQSLYFHQRHITDGAVTQFITTRFGNVLGSNGSVIPLFKRQIEEGGPVTVTHRDIIRYFMTIPEACALVLEAACMGRGGEIYIFDMGKPVKIYDMARKMIALSGLRPDVDIKIVETGLRPGEKLYEELLNDKERTMATLHKQIMIAKVVTYDYQDVVNNLVTLHQCLDKLDYHDIVSQMKIIVPEYVSNNSVWEAVDKELHHVNS